MGKYPGLSRLAQMSFMILWKQRALPDPGKREMMIEEESEIEEGEGARKLGQTLEARKAMEKDSPLETQQRNTALLTPGF